MTVILRTLERLWWKWVTVICTKTVASLKKTKANVWENMRADQWKPEMQSRVFTCSRILANFSQRFHEVMKAQITCFISFKKLLFSVLTKRKTIYEVCSSILEFLSWNCKFSQLRDHQPYCHVIFVHHNAMKTHL